MKKTILLIFGFLLVLGAQAQTVLFSDDFESYIPDTLLEPQSAKWVGWFGTQTQALVSKDTFASGKQSALIWDGAFPNGASPSDAVGQFGTLDKGRIELTFKQFVPAKIGTKDGGGYFNLQHNYQHTLMQGSWAIEVYALKPGTGMRGQVNTAGRQVFYNLVHDQWKEYRFVIDFSQDSAWMWYDSTFVYNWKWTSTSNSSTVTGPNQLNAIDLYASCLTTDSVNCRAYTFYDDFQVKTLPQPPALSEFMNTNPANNSVVHVQGAPTNTLTIEWQPTVSVKGDPVFYNILLDTVGGDFSNPLLTLRSNRQGRDTFLTFSYGQLANILGSQLQVPPGDSIELLWTAQAYTGFDTLLAAPAHQLRLIRGSVTGINLLDPNSISIFPNPNDGNFTLEFPLAYEKYDVELINSLGARVMAKRGLRNEEIISLSGLKPGTYILKVSGIEGIGYERIVIQH